MEGNSLSMAASGDFIVLAGLRYQGPITVEVSHYAEDGETALRLVSHEDGYPDPLATVTVHLVAATPAPGCIWVKDYSENAGIARELRIRGWIKPTGRKQSTGWVTVSEFELAGSLRTLVEQYQETRV